MDTITGDVRVMELISTDEGDSPVLPSHRVRGVQSPSQRIAISHTYYLAGFIWYYIGAFQSTAASNVVSSFFSSLSNRVDWLLRGSQPTSLKTYPQGS